MPQTQWAVMVLQPRGRKHSCIGDSISVPEGVTWGSREAGVRTAGGGLTEAVDGGRTAEAGDGREISNVTGKF